MMRQFGLTAGTRPLPLRAAASAVIGVGVLLGAVAYQHQFSRGMVTTGLRNVVPWGAYTVAYLTFVAVSAGALVLACAALLIRHDSLTQLVPAALATAVAGMVAGVAAFSVNLGRPARIYNLVLHPHWSSPVIWSLYSVLTSVVIALALLVVTRGRQSHIPSAREKVLAATGTVAGFVSAAAAAGIFTLQRGRPVWTNGVVMPVFLVSTALAGTAVVLLVARASGAGHVLPRDALTGLRRVIIAMLAAELVLTAIGYLTAVRSAPAQWAAMQLVLPGGGWSWLFWTQWLAGGVIPLAILVTPRWLRRPGALDAGAALAILGVVASYVALVPGGLASPGIALPPGMAVGASVQGGVSFQAVGFYHPTLTEYGVLLGLLCVFLAVLASVAKPAATTRGTA